MSEFKFACPVCGQHITADSNASGSQLDCPTCFRKIVVPQAPAARESKFVLAASEANRPRTVHSIPNPADPVQTTKSATGIVYVIAAGAMLLALISFASMWWFHSRLDQKAVERDEHNTPLPRIAGSVSWALDLTDASFPPETAFGQIREKDFVCDRAVLQGNTLHLRMGREWPPEAGISIQLYARSPDELSGRSALVATNNIRAPRVVLRWKAAEMNRLETLTNGYALKLEFGTRKGQRLPGKIYLCLPDESRSCVAGVFNAEIRKPAPKQENN